MRGEHRADLRVDEVERFGQQRARAYAVGAVAARSDRRRSGSFCAVETDWKFMPKIAGVPTAARAGVVVAVDLVEDRRTLIAVVLLRQRVVLGPVVAGRRSGATLLISGVNRSWTPVPDGPLRIS